MNAYRITGRFRMKDKWMPFSIELVSEDNDGAKEKLLSIIGSRHRVSRAKIEIEDVKGLVPDEITDPGVKYQMGGSDE